ncbi:mucin-binding protein [Lactobacillus helveticus]|uniref:mucin-binding protein n=1 Tax=Lactobacillus helveticus TaxID=1587 RepID=UPI001C6480D8|nr:hypothetical protein [Lactobacillus helveticus]MBW8009215.1 hypothetical protein [Lactobacillus helveticus]MBW8019256.1 hypothetical protein [Lactobacillus helveticus]MBW8043970.1 hypothetical protein [Lactobacillus helveticus]MBW8053375.1 hypothetical protein [Lactobacillus helveticus]
MEDYSRSEDSRNCQGNSRWFVVKIEHKTITVTPETPEGDIPTGKVPGDPSKTYPAMESITKTPTRTITVIKPDGSKLEIKQTVEFTRTATFDEVTGAVTYSDWKFAKSTAKGGKSQWDAYTPQAISGYTMHIEQKVGDKTTTISSIAAADVTEATGNVTITFLLLQVAAKAAKMISSQVSQASQTIINQEFLIRHQISL